MKTFASWIYWLTICDLQVSVMFCTTLKVTVSVSPVLVWWCLSVCHRFCDMQIDSKALMITSASRHYRRWEKGPVSVKIKENPCQELKFFGSRACVVFFVCLFSPWDFNILFCRGSAEQFHLPAFIKPSWWEAFTQPW